MATEVETTPEFKKIMELENQLNEVKIREDNLKNKLKATESEIQWLIQQYNTLLNASFNEVFEIAVKIKRQGLEDLLAKRNQEQEEAKTTQ